MALFRRLNTTTSHKLCSIHITTIMLLNICHTDCSHCGGKNYINIPVRAWTHAHRASWSGCYWYERVDFCVNRTELIYSGQFTVNSEKRYSENRPVNKRTYSFNKRNWVARANREMYVYKEANTFYLAAHCITVFYTVINYYLTGYENDTYSKYNITVAYHTVC